ncbi:MAG: hypothetical protein DI628_08030 [Blastochloris viridis]|uniref:DUF3617 family protein n=1 Tax=Blastochloris viridis TaxID=1079 RepID=A0A6N4R087_BLAVI|nr:MAG: hypothetical protein DI628_08030 [Blastochloris viridis]
MNVSAVVLGLALVISVGHAQERTAGAGLDAQMTWTAMSSQLDAMNKRVTATNAQVTQIIKCNEKMKLYAPAVAGVDSDGCMELPFVKETEYVESKGWQRPSYTLECTKGRVISYAMGNVSTNPNQMACGRTGANCDFNVTASLKGKTKWDVQVDPGKYVASFIECK